jgi:hypothetical protein
MLINKIVCLVFMSFTKGNYINGYLHFINVIAIKKKDNLKRADCIINYLYIIQ